MHSPLPQPLSVEAPFTHPHASLHTHPLRPSAEAWEAGFQGASELQLALAEEGRVALREGGRGAEGAVQGHTQGQLTQVKMAERVKSNERLAKTGRLGSEGQAVAKESSLGSTSSAVGGHRRVTEGDSNTVFSRTGDAGSVRYVLTMPPVLTALAS